MILTNAATQPPLSSHTLKFLVPLSVIPSARHLLCHLLVCVLVCSSLSIVVWRSATLCMHGGVTP